MVDGGQAGDPPVYFIDADSLVKLGRRFDDLGRFRGIWQRFEGLVVGGRLRSPNQAIKEACKVNPTVAAWTTTLSGLVVPESDLWADATSIVERFPDLAGDTLGQKGDPWLIALAVRHEQSRGLFGPHGIVITEEVSRRNAQRITRIPEVCRELHLECKDLWGLFDTEGWQIGVL